MYHPQGRYRYHYGINWRAVVAFAASLGPTLPGLAYNVNPNLKIGGAIYIADLNWYYGILVAAFTYAGISRMWPAHDSLVPCMINSVEDVTEGIPEGSEEVVTINTAEEKRLEY